MFVSASSSGILFQITIVDTWNRKNNVFVAEVL